MSAFNPEGVNAYPLAVNPQPIIAEAANVKGGTNPSFTPGDFFAFYPQFEGVIDQRILAQFIAMATAVVKKTRWHEQWEFGMNLFVAHFTTLYLQTLSGACAGSAGVIAAAQAKGLQTSKSVGDVSVSYDPNVVTDDLEGWAQWKLTAYGIQYASLAKLLGKAGSYIW